MPGPEGIPGGGPQLAGLAASGLLGDSSARSIVAGNDAREAARQLEGLFMTLLVKELRKSVPGDGLFGAGAGSSVYEGLFDQAFGAGLAEGPGTALRQAILESLQARAGKPGSTDVNSAPAVVGDGNQESARSSDHLKVSHDATVAVDTTRSTK